MNPNDQTPRAGGGGQSPDASNQPGQSLGPGDRPRRALEALVDAGWDPRAVSAELQPEARQIAEILAGLKAAPPHVGPSLVDRTLAGVWPEEAPAHLSPLDAEAADAWAQAGYRTDGVPEALRARAARHQQIAVLLRSGAGAHGAIRPGQLADRTSRLVDLVSTDAEDDLAPIAIGRGAWMRRRAWDLVSAAAMLLVAASIMWPVLAGLRQRGLELQCNSNLQSVASAMSAYAGENKDSMPVVVAALGPQRWWDVDSRRPVANSSNLFTLVKAGYSKLAALACPGNPRAPRTDADPSASDWRSLDEISYSYQLMSGSQAPKWNGSDRRLILADRSPAVLRAVAGKSPNPNENSPNHHGRGQHGLFTDGSTDWLESSWLPASGDEVPDCIWLPRPRYRFQGTVEQHGDEVVVTLTGHEVPADGSDVFLGP